MFHSLLKKHGLSPDDCSGGKLRLLILNFEEIIIPSLVFDKANKQAKITEKIRTVLSIFQTITWVAYSPEEAQTYDGIKLLLRYKCYELSLALQGLGDLKLMDLYLHVILSHFPDFFDEFSFFVSSTEPLEGLFITTKRCKHMSNRHKRNVLKKVIKRFQYLSMKGVKEETPEVYLDNITRKENTSKENKFLSFRNKLREIEDPQPIQIPLEDDNSITAQQTKAFLCTVLSNQHYKNNVKVKEGKVYLKMREDLHRFLNSYYQN